jgi:hypothetical protein
MKKILFILLTLVLGAGLVFAQAAPDPIRLATGARPLGMGKAFVGLADDIGSLFLNPAGIANPERWQVTSMSGNLLEEFNYLTFSGLYPTNFGNFGLAYCGSSITGAFPTTIEAGSDPSDPIYIIDTAQNPMSYYNNLLILSYGDNLERILSLPLLSAIGSRLPGLKQINFGFNVKLFSVNLTGDGITQGNASGNEVDIGMQGKALSWLSLGANIQNVLPFSMGGKLHYDTGWEESYPAVLKLGAAADIFGPENALFKLGGHKVKLLTDLDYEIQRADKVPTLFHLGVEWKPLDLIAIRTGIDQEMVGVGKAANNFTGGVGVYYRNFRFDYAYHQFEGAPGIDNHFFSLSYGLAPPKALIEEPLIASPDKLITTDLAVTAKGTAVDTEIITVRVNGRKAALSPRGDFQSKVTLNVGKNAIQVEGYNQRGILSASKKLRVLRLITYPDVIKTYWANDQISYIGTLGIIKGYPDGRFRPEGNITRAELSALIVRTKVGGDKNVPIAKKIVFRDVPLKHWAAKYVNLASENRIVKGYPDGTFKPSANITRAEGLAMIARFGGVKEVTYGKEFTDVTPKHWAASIISGAYKEGMLIFLKGKPFEPNKKLTRAEAVEMLYRSRPVSALITDLLDFEKGY